MLLLLYILARYGIPKVGHPPFGYATPVLFPTSFTQHHRNLARGPPGPGPPLSLDLEAESGILMVTSTIDILHTTKRPSLLPEVLS